MTTFIVPAAKAYLAAAEQGKLTGDDLELENDQLVQLLDELTSLRQHPETQHQRAERGRIAVQLFGFNDDIDTMAADVIADILHYVALTVHPDAAGRAYFTAARYYNEEAR